MIPNSSLLHLKVKLRGGIVEKKTSETGLRLAAYASSRRKAMMDPSVREILPYWRLWTANDNHVCAICKPLHLFVARWDDPVWDDIYPQLHEDCRCIVVPITASEAPPEASIPGRERLLRSLPLRAKEKIRNTG